MDALYASAAVRMGPSIPRVLVLLSIVLAPIGCSSSELPVPHSGWPTSDECVSTTADAFYFPAGALIPDDPQGDLNQRRTLGAYFRAVELESLSCGKETEAYRIFWGGGYGVTATVITLSRGSARAAQFLPPNERSFAVSRTASASITPEQLDELRTQLDTSSFWRSRPMVDLEGEGNVWVVEARRGRTYKVITRVTLDAALADTVRKLVELTGLRAPERMKAR
jgi:hypothetical protein